MVYSMRLSGVCQPPKARKEQRRRQRLRALQAGLGKEEHRARPQAGVCRAHVRRKQHGSGQDQPQSQRARELAVDKRRRQRAIELRNPEQRRERRLRLRCGNG